MNSLVYAIYAPGGISFHVFKFYEITTFTFISCAFGHVKASENRRAMIWGPVYICISVEFFLKDMVINFAIDVTVVVDRYP